MKHEHFRQFQYLVNHTYQAIPTQERVRQSRFVLFVYNNAATVYICLLYLQELDGCRVVRVIWHSDILGLGVCFEGSFVPNRSAWQDSWWMSLCTTWWIARLANRPAHSSFLCPEHQESSNHLEPSWWSAEKSEKGILTCKVQHLATSYSFKISPRRGGCFHRNIPEPPIFDRQASRWRESSEWKIPTCSTDPRQIPLALSSGPHERCHGQSWTIVQGCSRWAERQRAWVFRLF